MSDLREQLESALNVRPKTAHEAEQAAKAAEALAAYLRLEDSVGRLLRDEPGKDQDRKSFASATLHEAARRVLEQAGTPLHAREIGQRIKAGGWTHKRSANPRPDQIVYQLAARLPRHPDVFVRVAPNTFALVEWDVPSRRPRPRVGLFGGEEKPNGRDIGERPGEPAGAGQWRSF